VRRTDFGGGKQLLSNRNRTDNGRVGVDAMFFAMADRAALARVGPYENNTGWACRRAHVIVS
tara:strand:- start:110 stop:295 length:186 start_codon:yes stop_codon:yes gene_type:complete